MMPPSAAMQPLARNDDVAFSCLAAYSPLSSLMLVVCPTILFSLAAYMEWIPDDPAFHFFHTILIPVLNLYNAIHAIFGLTIFPSRYEYSSRHQTLTVHTVFPLYPNKCIPFPGIRSAKPYAMSVLDTETRRWPFVTMWNNVVLVQRQVGWDLLVSVQDPKGLVEAIDAGTTTTDI